MNFLKRILRQTCPHRFAWPRSDDHGGHYQTCLACGTVFEYDWTAMRRTGRQLSSASSTLGHPERRRFFERGESLPLASELRERAERGSPAPPA